jgi:hypothetical protein
MHLDEVTAEIRPRHPWEAVDLGIALVREHYGALFRIWASTALPLALSVIALSLVFPFLVIPLGPLTLKIPIALVVVPWFKPLYDIPLLFYLSRALFGSRPTIAETLRAAPALIFRSAPRRLLWLRFGPARSLAMPIELLEGLRGRPYALRVSLLSRTSGGHAALSTSLFGLIELFALFGLIGLALLLIPPALQPDWLFFFIDLTSLNFEGFLDLALHPATFSILALIYFFAISLVEPFYVGAGFGLYLNARTRLEGWDIELALRRLALRLAPPQQAKEPALNSTLTSLLALAIVVSACALLTGTTVAQQAQGETSDETPLDPSLVIREIKAQPEFETQRFTRVRYVRDEPTSSRNFSFGNWSGGVLSLLGGLGQGLFWLLIAAVLGAIVVLLWRNRRLLSSRASPEAPQARATSVMGLDIRQSSLPKDIPSHARQLWEQGDFQAALSLLYRASLAWLVRSAHLPIEESDTEQDCLDHASSLERPALESYLRQLTAAWIAAAYNRQPPSRPTMESLLSEFPFTPQRSLS